MKEQKIIYYTDELNDEFSTAKITPIKIDRKYKWGKNKYKYRRNILWNIASFIVQNILSMPIKVGYAKIKFRIKYIGKEKLKKYKKEGYFVYVNHTQAFADTFIPSIAIYPKRNFLIVNPENISMKFSKNIIEMLGAIPVPGDKESMKNFIETIESHIKKRHSITIYPEAHIWPYYTKIRPFKAVSFAYPVNLGRPTFSMTNTYQRYGKNKDKIKIVTYIDGPFLPKQDLPKKEQKQDLRDRVYNCMVERSRNSNIEYIKYIKKKNQDPII